MRWPQEEKVRNSRLSNAERALTSLLEHRRDTVPTSNGPNSATNFFDRTPVTVDKYYKYIRRAFVQSFTLNHNCSAILTQGTSEIRNQKYEI